MEIILATLILGALLGALLLIQRARHLGNVEVDQSKNKAKILKNYTRAEISAHNKRTDCWIIIKDKVYDVSPYVETHPGGDAILTHAGDDATKGFYGPQHASLVYDMIDEYYIGDLSSDASTTYSNKFNEPHTYMIHGYDVGLQALGWCSIFLHLFCGAGNSATEAYIVAHSVVLTHGTVSNIYRRK